MAFIVRNNCIAAARYCNFQDKIIGRIRKERAPEEENAVTSV